MFAGMRISGALGNKISSFAADNSTAICSFHLGVPDKRRSRPRLYLCVQCQSRISVAPFGNISQHRPGWQHCVLSGR
ncbi:hypothetical protein KCP74_00565 [Salmonella enterica subsp. enterica]|nr:hypothetical protein KCP74_00565 [Salmonella enterica subsp. enterica]